MSLPTSVVFVPIHIPCGVVQPDRLKLPPLVHTGLAGGDGEVGQESEGLSERLVQHVQLARVNRRRVDAKQCSESDPEKWLVHTSAHVDQDRHVVVRAIPRGMLGLIPCCADDKNRAILVE